MATLIRRIRQLRPECSVEVLIPDFKGSLEALKIVMDARPGYLNHNLETIPRLFRSIQPQSSYEASQATLVNAKKLSPGTLTKSGLMVGLGDTLNEVKETMADIRAGMWISSPLGNTFSPAGTIAVDRFYTPDEFEELKVFGRELGFNWVESAPLVRSSYHAAEQVRALRRRTGYVTLETRV